MKIYPNHPKIKGITIYLLTMQFCKLVTLVLLSSIALGHGDEVGSEVGSEENVAKDTIELESAELLETDNLAENSHEVNDEGAVTEPTEENNSTIGNEKANETPVARASSKKVSCLSLKGQNVTFSVSCSLENNVHSIQ